jgi:hypothetical protein
MCGDMDAGNWIALAALVLSVGSLGWQWSARRRALVNVHRENIKGERVFETWLVLDNFGSALARDVNVSFEGIANESDRPRLQWGPRQTPPLPAAFLPPSGRLRVQMQLWIDAPSTFDVEVSWNDGRFRRQRRTITI